MTINANLDLLKAELKERMDNLSKRKDEDKRKTTFIIAFGGLASALTTILIGLSSYLSEYATYISIAALITSAGVTVIHAWDNLFNHKKLWILQTVCLSGLKELKNDIAHLEANGNIEQEAINNCLTRFKEINKTFITEWKDLRIKG